MPKDPSRCSRLQGSGNRQHVRSDYRERRHGLRTRSEHGIAARSGRASRRFVRPPDAASRRCAHDRRLGTHLRTFSIAHVFTNCRRARATSRGSRTTPVSAQTVFGEHCVRLRAQASRAESGRVARRPAACRSTTSAASSRASSPAAIGTRRDGSGDRPPPKAFCLLNRCQPRTPAALLAVRDQKRHRPWQHYHLRPRRPCELLRSPPHCRLRPQLIHTTLPTAFTTAGRAVRIRFTALPRGIPAARVGEGGRVIHVAGAYLPVAAKRRVAECASMLPRGDVRVAALSKSPTARSRRVTVDGRVMRLAARLDTLALIKLWTGVGPAR